MKQDGEPADAPPTIQELVAQVEADHKKWSDLRAIQDQHELDWNIAKSQTDEAAVKLGISKQNVEVWLRTQGTRRGWR